MIQTEIISKELELSSISCRCM